MLSNENLSEGIITKVPTISNSTPNNNEQLSTSVSLLLNSSINHKIINGGKIRDTLPGIINGFGYLVLQ